LTSLTQRVTIYLPLGMKILQNLVKTQGTLIDVMSNQYREDDDLDCILRDALRRHEAMAPEPGASFAVLRCRLADERSFRSRPWSLVSPGWTSSHMSASYWYLAPLTRFAR
jgi:hypothetical protein